MVFSQELHQIMPADGAKERVTFSLIQNRFATFVDIAEPLARLVPAPALLEACSRVANASTVGASVRKTFTFGDFCLLVLVVVFKDGPVTTVPRRAAWKT